MQKHKSSLANPATQINGLDAEALGAVASELGAHPERALARFYTQTEWRGGLATQTRVDRWSLGGHEMPRHFVIDSDEPAALLGRDTAPNPQELLFSAVAACLTVTYVVAASAQGIALDALRVEMRGSLDLRGPMGLSDDVPRGCPQVECDVHVRSSASRAELQALHEAALALSANVEHLTRAVPLVARLRANDA